MCDETVVVVVALVLLLALEVISGAGAAQHGA